MKIAIAQINTRVGDFEGNFDKILKFSKKAKSNSCDLVIFPQFSISGFNPFDFFWLDSFAKENAKYLDKLKTEVKGIALLIGSMVIKEETVLSGAYLFENGKTLFEIKDGENSFNLKGLNFSVSMGDNILFEEPESDIVINLASYKYQKDLEYKLWEVLSNFAKQNSVSLILSNQVGGNDSDIFEGASAVFDKDGKVLANCKDFKEDFLCYDFNKSDVQDIKPISQNEVEANFKALTLGAKDYLKKTGFEKYIIALSGGIDSALTAAIAVEAVGSENVSSIFMPSEYTSQDNFEDTEKLAKNLNIKREVIYIDDVVKSFEKTNIFKNADKYCIARQNIQARIRGNILMSMANRENALVLNTGNKSEAAVGYCTLYGDSCGSLSVISDLYKREVYALSNFINLEKEIIPKRIIEKAPSAELKPDQKDKDDIPDYPILDEILYLYIEKGMGIDDITKKGFDKTTVCEIIRRLRQSEYKRKQSPIGLSLSVASLGNFNYPIATKYIK